jgi:tRNA 5-methylaminomethyl-2-thiouridine biosynthesis bifunctional protein
MSILRETLESARIEWRDDTTPVNQQFDDIYFSSDALGESRYVFLEQNRLPERWQQPLRTFCVGETGFGTGLNFLLCWQLWQQLQAEDARLHFISVEKHPLRRADLARALSAFPELADLAAALVAQYPALLTGQHTLHFDDGRITLHLLFGDALDMLHGQLPADPPPADWQGPVDAWFLDGFAPRQNPELWQQQLFTLVRQLSNDNSSYATFSAAALVKDSLKAAGFSVEKRKGYGKKRDMLAGLALPLAKEQATRPLRAGSYRFPGALWTIGPDTSAGREVLVIGAGIAGCTTANALAQRGFKVDILDAGGLCAGASGNPQPSLYGRFSPFSGPANDFSLQAYLYALRYYPEKLINPIRPSGLLQLQNAKEEKQMRLLAEQMQDNELMQLLPAEKASGIAGINIEKPALYFPRASWIDCPALCESLLQHDRIQRLPNAAVTALSRTGEHWNIQTDRGLLQHEGPVVLCLGADIINQNLHPALGNLPLKAIRGQVNFMPSTAKSQALKTVICDDSFLAPAFNGEHSFGASYSFDLSNKALSEKEQNENYCNLQKLCPSLMDEEWQHSAREALPGRVSRRCVSADYLPLVGPVPQPEAFLRDYAKLGSNANAIVRQTSDHVPDLYLNTAYGSRGLSFAPLCAELLASRLNGEPEPLPARLQHALLPARFLIRNICRGHFATD